MEALRPGCEDAAAMPEQTSTRNNGRRSLVQLQCKTVFLVDLEIIEPGDDLSTWLRVATYSLPKVARLVNASDVVNSFVHMLPFRAHLAEPQTCVRVTELHVTEEGTWLFRTESGEQFVKFGYLEPVALRRVDRLSRGSELEDSPCGTDALTERSADGATAMSARMQIDLYLEDNRA